MWDLETTEEFEAWFEQLPEPLREQVDARVRLLETVGPALKRPHADTLNGSKHPNMKELRVDEQGAVIRIAFAFDPNRTGILLVAGDKAGVGSSKQFYKRLISKADSFYDRHLEKIGKGHK